MRGSDRNTESLFVYVTPESFVPKDHPLRPIRLMADKALREMDAHFERLYASSGRPSIPPEKLLKAQLLMILYSIRSNRQLVEQIRYNLLFRWFLGMAMDEKVWDHSSFSQNQERLIGSETAAVFLSGIIKQAEKKRLLSREHFTVDGTLIEAWASVKSFRPKDGPPSTGGGGRNDSVDFHGQTLSNDTHESSSDPQARFYRKGNNREAKLCYQGHLLMENRNGLIIDSQVTIASGTAEREAALTMIDARPRKRRVTLGGDKGYDTREFVRALRERNVTPHLARNDSRRKSSIDGRTTSHPNYAISQRVRKRIEEGFGWMKTVGRMRKTLYRGLEKINWQLTLHAAAYNLVRMRTLGVAAP